VIVIIHSILGGEEKKMRAMGETERIRTKAKASC
jgi:hypothetical protein